MNPIVVTAAVAGLIVCAFGLCWWVLAHERRRVRAELTAVGTQLRQMAAERDLLEARIRAVLRPLAEGVLVTDADLRILIVNPAAVRLLSLAATSVEGRLLTEVAVDRGVLSAIEQAIAAGGASDQPVRRMGPGAGPLQITVAPAGSDMWVVVAADVTERTRLEALRREFVANVSHELRTPMAAIRALAETLRDGAHRDADVAVQFLDSIISEADRLTRIADDLLTLSDAETKPPELGDVDLSELCRRVVAKLRPHAERAGLVLEEAVQESVIVRGDGDQLEQVVLNLLDNAIKYTPNGGTVRVGIEWAGDCAVLTVRDTGIGIMQEHIPRIFERFYRVDKARSRESGGTGLGLSIVKHIVESHGGSVSAESEYGRGSTFTVRLPCLSPDAAGAQSPEQAKQI